MTNKEQEKINHFMAWVDITLGPNWNPDIQGEHPREGERIPMFQMDDNYIWRMIEDKLYMLRVSRFSKLLILELTEKLLLSFDAVKTGYRENLL